MNYKAIIFDLDGTLLDSSQVWVDIDIEYEKKYGIDMPDNYDETINGMSFAQLAEYYADVLGVPLEPKEIMAEWNSMADSKYRYEVQLLDNAYEFLREQHEKGVKMCIATANSRELTEAALTRLGVMDCIQFVLSCDDIGCGKDTPEIYLESARRLGVDVKDAIVFEDIPNGIISASNGGFDTCAVCGYSFSTDDEKMRKLATMCIHGYDELVQR